MARDLIPPPSPAGRPERETFQAAYPTDLEHDKQQEPTAGLEEAVPAVESRFRSRFGFLTGALIGIGIAAMIVAALVVARGDVRTVEPQWSAWKPPASTDDNATAAEIAFHVGRQYRLNNGDQLVKVDAGPLAVDGVPLQIAQLTSQRGEGGDILPIGGNSMLYVLHGLGKQGSIAAEKPTEERLRLIQREAIELALYTFKYAKDVDNVIAFLPPAPPGPEAGSGLGAGEPTLASGKTVPAMMFRPGDLEAQLRAPLAESLPGPAPRPGSITPELVDTLANFTAKHWFTASVVADQTSGGVLVLEPQSSSSAATEEALRSLIA